MGRGRTMVVTVHGPSASRPAPARDDYRSREKALSALAVLAIHAGVGVALLNGSRILAPERDEALRVFEFPQLPREEVAATPEVETASAREAPALAAEQDASSPAPRRPVAPRPGVAARAKADPPAATSLAVAALPPGTGLPASTGGEQGSGTGADGTGASGGSTGQGGGSVAVGARQLGGKLFNADYPRVAREVGAEGTVLVRFAVDPRGRATGCVVTQSSGHAALDETTCRLIERRFRYEPARDADGRPVADVIVGRQTWWLERRGPALADAASVPPVTRPGQGRTNPPSPPLER